MGVSPSTPRDGAAASPSDPPHRSPTEPPAPPLLTAGTLVAYLQERAVMPDDVGAEVTELSGGVSNVVLHARWPSGQVVVKQSLAQLRVAADWRFDRRRILVEADALALLERVLPGRAPTLVFTDPAHYALGMSMAPAGGVVWKAAHMRGEIVPSRAVFAAELLVELQRRTAGDAEVAARFDDLMPLREGRIEPYHRAVIARHPDLTAPIEAEIARIESTRRVLVHGDFSPKNLIAYPSSMLMIDLEVAHWGDPAFDVAFMLSLLLTGSCLPGRGGILTEAERFWRSYKQGAGEVAPGEDEVISALGCLLLARVDGKSPVEYLIDEGSRERVRAFARSLILAGAGSVLDVLERVPRELHGVGG